MKSKGLEILAREIGQEIEEKNAELLARNIEVPEDYHEEMLALIRKLNQETARRKKAGMSAVAADCCNFRGVFCVIECSCPGHIGSLPCKSVLSIL